MKDKLRNLPKAGARIIKSAVGSALCIAVYFLRRALYRNYTHKSFRRAELEKVIYLMVLAENEKSERYN